jgi:general secretion pathway protein F
MPTFEYRAIDLSGKVIAGVIEAASRAEVVEHLDRNGCTPISAQEKAAGAKSWSWRDWLTPEPRSEDITTLTLDLSMLLKGGVTLDEALLILAQMETRRWQIRVLRDLHREIAGGKSFSQALAKHPRLFTPIYVKMVEVAETSGRLDEALSGLAGERQRIERLRKRFVSAIAYPVFLIFAAFAVLSFVLIYLIPRFETALQGFREKIDPSALFVFQVSKVLNEHLDLFLVSLTLILMGSILLSRVGRGRPIWVSILSRLPMTRTIMTYELTLTFCWTLAILVRNDVNIPTSLRLIRGVVRLPSVAEQIDRVTDDIRQGQRLSEALARRQLLPRHVVQMLRVGEEAGNLAESAGRVATFYEAKLDAALGRVIAVVGPAMMIVVSLLIAWVILSVVTALISINDLLV